MTSPLMLSVVAGMAIATILLFMFKGEERESTQRYEHGPNQERQRRQCTSQYQRRTQYPRNDDLCAICLDSFSISDFLLLPCKHFFHKSCLRRLITINNIRALCPVCRSPIPRYV